MTLDIQHSCIVEETEYDTENTSPVTQENRMKGSQTYCERVPTLGLYKYPSTRSCLATIDENNYDNTVSNSKQQQYDSSINPGVKVCLSSDHNVQKSGAVHVVMENTRKMSVRAKVYRSRLDHYILLSTNRLINANQKYINLKNTHVEKVGENLIRITPNKDIEGQSLLLRIPYEKDVDSWLQALSSEKSRTPMGSPIIPRTPLMPTLEESDEDSDDLC